MNKNLADLLTSLYFTLALLKAYYFLSRFRDVCYFQDELKTGISLKAFFLQPTG